MSFESYASPGKKGNHDDIPETYDTGCDGLHNENLFDQNERSDGALYNEATGEVYDNSTFTDESLFWHEGQPVDGQMGYVFDPLAVSEEEPDDIDQIIADFERDSGSN